jgi:hypothetical protein
MKAHIRLLLLRLERTAVPVVLAVKKVEDE